jgi:phenylalanyl-tRNA synthetase beta chain
MLISLHWLNEYLQPGGLTPDQVEHALTFAGLPIESCRPAPGDAGDTILDVEVTSNRGDCLSHVGIAREVAAAVEGQTLRLPEELAPRGSGGAGERGTAAGAAPGPSSAAWGVLRNQVPDDCPRFTLRLIRGVRIGPSPDWLRRRLEAIGQRSINAVVDCTNFVLHELGVPSHVFDATALAPGEGGKLEVRIRRALAGERLTLLDGREVSLTPGDVVVADARRPLSIAGVMGGRDSGVTERTADVLLEVATWNPVSVRQTARRLSLRTDSSHRYERVVDARQLDEAAARLVALIRRVAGGTVEPVALDDTGGRALPAPEVVTLRPSRCRDLLGWDLPTPEMARALRAQGFGVEGSDPLTVRVPVHRVDVRAEVDLIEEVARTVGYDRVPQPETMGVRVAGLQASRQAEREVGRVLTGAGFFETVTFSFVSERQARAFLAPGLRLLGVGQAQRGAEGILRPSVLPSLLSCRRVNQDAKVESPGGVRLYEVASVFAERDGGEGGDATPGPRDGRSAPTLEHRVLALLVDADASLGASALERAQAALRLVRGVLDELVIALCGEGASLRVEPGGLPWAALDPAAGGRLLLDGRPVGVLGLVAAPVLKQWDLAVPVVAAEVSLAPLIERYPPRRRVRALPQFPSIRRDLSLVVDEPVTWSRVEATARRASPALMRGVEFVGVYRGRPLEPGKKSVTLRVEFRDESRTLRDEEVAPQVQALVEAFARDLGATLRA